MLHFGAPLIFSWLAAFVLNFSDRFFLEHYSNLSQVGLYAVAYKFGYVLNLILVQPFYLTWEPQAYEIAKREDASRVFARIFSFYSVTLFTFAFVLSLVIREVFTIMVDPKFFIAYQLVPLIAFAYVAQGLQGFFESGLLITKHSRVVGLIGIACTAICLLLNLVLIRFWTMWGACIATFISFCMITLASYRYSDRYYPLGCDMRPLAKVAVIGGLLLFTGWMLPVQSTGLRVAIKVVIAAAYFVTIFKMGVFEDKDVQEIHKMAAGWVRKQLTVTVGWLQFLNPVSKRSE
jgi:O-antigen/teichoic acid export membrane protein